MKDAIKIVLLLVGAYLVWLYLSRRGVTAPPQPATTEGPTAATVPASATPDLVAAAAARAGYPAGATFTADQWNWFYRQARGTDAPDPLEVWPNRDRSYRMTLAEWWSGMSGAGLAGLRALRKGVC